MAWQEALAGLFGGVAGGLDDIQRTRQRDAQMKLQQDEAKRQAVKQAQDQLYRSYEATPEGSEIDPAMASQYKAAGFGGLTADGGKIVKAKSPQTQMLELTYEKAQQDAQERQKKFSVTDQIHNAGSGWFEQDQNTRLAMTRSVGLDDDVALTPMEKAQMSPQVMAAGINARPNAVETSRLALDRERMEIDRQRLDSTQYAAAADKARSLATNVAGQLDPNKYSMFLQQELSALKGQVPSQSTPSRSTLPAGTRGMVKGIPAVWDGRQWVEE